MMWAAFRDSASDLFMRAPIDEVAHHLCRELGDGTTAEWPQERTTGFPSEFSIDPLSVARPGSGFTTFS